MNITAKNQLHWEHHALFPTEIEKMALLPYISLLFG